MGGWVFGGGGEFIIVIFRQIFHHKKEFHLFWPVSLKCFCLFYDYLGKMYPVWVLLVFISWQFPVTTECKGIKFNCLCCMIKPRPSTHRDDPFGI